MATQAQIESNRRNAQKSTGPRTSAGLAQSKLNAIKHGLCAKVTVMRGENPQEYQELLQGLMDDWQPATQQEAHLVMQIGESYWRLLRAKKVETGAWDLKYQVQQYIQQNAKELDRRPTNSKDQLLWMTYRDSAKEFEQLENYLQRLERSYYKAIAVLTNLQKQRPNTQIGFVPPKPKQERETPEPAPQTTAITASATAETSFDPPSFDPPMASDAT